MKTKYQTLSLVGALLSICLLVSSCMFLNKKKQLDLNKPVEAIETLGNDVSSASDEWSRDDWDNAADNLETALKALPDPLADDEKQIVTSTLSRISVYAGRHQRLAAGMISVIDNYNKLAVAPAAPSTASDLLPAHVIQEGGYTNVRQDPSTSAPIVTKIADGSPIKYKKYNASWCIVYDLAGNRQGYMHASKVIPDTGMSQGGNAVATGTQYDWLAQRRVTLNDLSGQNLRILRNAIYARHGRIFKDAGLRQYFNSQSWYHGTRNEIPAGELNQYEKYNIEFIKSYE